jgi:hypothetical protein
MEFYAWFDEEQRKVNGIGPDIYAHLLTHGVDVTPRKEVAELEEGIAKLEQKPRETLTFADLESALRPVLTILDLRKLMLCHHDAKLWMQTALDAAASRFNIPADLSERMLRVLEPR